MRRGAPVDLEHLLYLVERFRVNDGGDTALHSDLPVFEIVDADILLVFEHRPEAVLCVGLPTRRQQSPAVEFCGDLRDRLPSGVHGKDFPDYRGRIRVNDKIFLVVQFVPHRDKAARVLAFLGVLPVAPADILRQLEAVIFRHALQNTFQYDSFRGIWQVLRDILHPDPVAFGLILVKGDLFPVAPEAVNFPHDDNLKLPGRAILEHTLKFVSVVIPASLRPVNVFPDDCIPPGHCVGLSGGYLPLNGLLPLTVRRIPGVNHSDFPGSVRRVVIYLHGHAAYLSGAEILSDVILKPTFADFTQVPPIRLEAAAQRAGVENPGKGFTNVEIVQTQ